jgi:BirA family biotin operon repressor/biotin-[acetyl-CoA-carboxylase] ligase
MATPYFQLRRDEVTSTQDEARALIDQLPVVVIAQRQTGGRGRTGARWLTAPRALAVSAAYRQRPGDTRPISLMAGVAAVRSLGEVDLKWPNDLLRLEAKVGGILVERDGEVVTAGLGLNLWWPGAPAGIGAIEDEDPGPRAHAEIGALWAAELLGLVAGDGWPIDEYRAHCATLGREVAWDPDGHGLATGISDRGELLVEHGGIVDRISAGAVRHVRY